MHSDRPRAGHGGPPLGPGVGHDRSRLSEAATAFASVRMLSASYFPSLASASCAWTSRRRLHWVHQFNGLRRVLRHTPALRVGVAQVVGTEDMTLLCGTLVPESGPARLLRLAQPFVVGRAHEEDRLQHARFGGVLQQPAGLWRRPLIPQRLCTNPPLRARSGPAPQVCAHATTSRPPCRRPTGPALQHLGGRAVEAGQREVADVESKSATCLPWWSRSRWRSCPGRG